jgi:phasin family protein
LHSRAAESQPNSYALVSNVLEESTSESKKIFACKNVLNVFSTQKELVEASYSKAMEQSKKITDLSVKLGQDASVLISNRVNAAVETLSNPLPA